MLLAQKRLVPECCRFQPRTDADCERFGRQLENVLLIEPVEFFRIEDRAAAADAGEIEYFGQFPAGEQFTIAGSWRPAQQRQKIHHGLGQIALSRVLHHGRRAMPLAQALPVRSKNQRHVREGRHSRLDRLVQQNLLRRVRDVIVATHHMRDLHLHIV